MKKLFAAFFMLSLLTGIVPVQAINIPEGAAIKTAGNPDVYIVKYMNGKSFKRLVLNPRVFSSYGHLRWENVLTVSQTEIGSFIDSDLVRVDGQNAVYRLIPAGDNGSKVLVSDTKNLDSDSVYTINNMDFGNYTEEASELYSVHKIIDGDTLSVTIDGIGQTIRLIGIDTPEIAGPYTSAECYGAEASSAAKEKLAGKKVRLAADTVSGNRDKYGRLLRYVYLEDGTLLNEWLVLEGYAYEYTYNNISYEFQAEFKAAQILARQNQKGLWEACTR